MLIGKHRIIRLDSPHHCLFGNGNEINTFDTTEIRGDIFRQNGFGVQSSLVIVIALLPQDLLVSKIGSLSRKGHDGIAFTVLHEKGSIVGGVVDEPLRESDVFFSEENGVGSSKVETGDRGSHSRKKKKKKRKEAKETSDRAGGGIHSLEKDSDRRYSKEVKMMEEYEMLPLCIFTRAQDAAQKENRPRSSEPHSLIH